MTTRKHAAIAILAALAVTLAGVATLTPTSASTPLDDQASMRNACVARLNDPRPLTSAQRTWLRTCRDVFAPASASPSPSASASASPSSSPSASPSPSLSPSPSPSPTVSPTPTPSPTGTPTAGCMPQPSLCGYPDETNTGVPAGTQLTAVNGDWHITSSGVYSGRDVSGCVYVEASNVTIRESRIRGNCWFSVRTTGINGNHPGLTIQDTEIVLASTLEGAYGICCSEYTLTRVWIHSAPSGNAGADCVYFANNVRVEDSFCDVGPVGPAGCLGNPSCTSAHSDGMTSDGGNNVLLSHNTIRNPNRQTSAILLSTNSASVTNTRIFDGLYAGGGYTVYCGTDAGGVDAGTVFSGNRIARDWNGAAPGYWPNGGYWGPTVHCGGLGNGNVWDDTGFPLP